MVVFPLTNEAVFFYINPRYYCSINRFETLTYIFLRKKATSQLLGFGAEIPTKALKLDLSKSPCTFGLWHCEQKGLAWREAKSWTRPAATFAPLGFVLPLFYLRRRHVSLLVACFRANDLFGKVVILFVASLALCCGGMNLFRVPETMLVEFFFYRWRTLQARTF